jgi:MFS family permease
LSGVLDLLLDVAVHAFGGSRNTRRRPHPMLAGLGLLALGGVGGGLTTWLFPMRLLGAPLVPGASLVISPLLNGTLMHYYGSWHARRQRARSFAATFWGGALFAFGFALVRFLTVSGP